MSKEAVSVKGAKAARFCEAEISFAMKKLECLELVASDPSISSFHRGILMSSFLKKALPEASLSEASLLFSFYAGPWQELSPVLFFSLLFIFLTFTFHYTFQALLVL